MNTMTNQRGLTLIETVITLAILSFGLVAVMKLQSYMIGHSAIAKQQAQAMTLAQKKIEELRDFQQINTGAGVKAYDDISSASENISGTNANYTLSWTVTDQTSPDHKVINMNISWPDKNGVTRTIQLSSIISKTDPATEGGIMTSSSAGGIQPPN